MSSRQANIIFAVLVVLGLVVIWLLMRVLYHPTVQFCWGSYDYCRR